MSLSWLNEKKMKTNTLTKILEIISGCYIESYEIFIYNKNKGKQK